MSSFFGFTSSLLTLVLLRGTLGSQSIDVSLSVGSSLLEFTESLDLVLLLLGNTPGFSDLLFFSLSSLTLVLQDLLLKASLVGFLLLFEIQGLSVGSLDLHHHFGDLHFFVGYLDVLYLILLGDVGQELESLLLSHLLLTHAEAFAFLNLVDNNLGTAVLRLFAADLAVFLLLEVLQTLNLHHEVKLFLFADPFGFECLALDELLVTDGDDLGVQDHLVHLLDVVLLFVHQSLGFSQKGLNSLHVIRLLCCRRQSGSTETVVTFHGGLAGVMACSRLVDLCFPEDHVLLLLLS